MKSVEIQISVRSINVMNQYDLLINSLSPSPASRKPAAARHAEPPGIRLVELRLPRRLELRFPRHLLPPNRSTLRPTVPRFR